MPSQIIFGELHEMIFFDVIKTILRIVITIGTILGLSVGVYAALQGDWKISLIASIWYVFSLLLLA